MPSTEPVPEADRLEQQMPVSDDQRTSRPHPPDAPDADVLEQDRPLAVELRPSGIDADRSEPVSDDDWSAAE